MVERIIVVAPAGPGSKDDEGRLLGALQVLKSVPVHLLNPETESLWTDVLGASDDVSFVTEHQGAITDFLPNVRSSDAVLIVGADVTEGAYDPALFLERLDFLKKALSRGARGVIMCSLGPDVDQRIVSGLKELPAASVFLRDAGSFENYARQVGTNAEFFPDLSYVPSDLQDRHGEADLTAWISRIRERGGKIVGLNFSERLFRAFSDERTDEARSALVGRVIRGILKAAPDACFVLISNGSRAWKDHPSDDTYQTLAAGLLQDLVGTDRFAVQNPLSPYGDNIVLMRCLDLLITGREALAHAAARQGTLPLMMTGLERHRSSTDETRGMFEAVHETGFGTINVIEDLEAALRWAQERMPSLEGQLDQWNGIWRFEEGALRPMLLRSLGLSTAPPGGDEMFVAHARQRDVGHRLALKQSEQPPGRNASWESPEVRQLTYERGRLQMAADALVIETDRLAHRVARTYGRPSISIVRIFQRVVLKLVLLFEPVMSRRTASRFRRSVRKRTPAFFLSEWAEFAAHIGALAGLSIQVPSTPQRERANPSTVVYRLLRLLSRLSRPLSPRQAEKLRRSAEKRNPLRSHSSIAAMSSASVRSVDMIDANRARRILVADSRLPRADVSAGDRATLGVISDLCAIGYEVVFVPVNMTAVSPGLESLQALGVKVITRDSGYAEAEDYVRAMGGQFGAFYFVRLDVAETLLVAARQAAPDARIIFHAPDLYSLRESRGAGLSGSAAERKLAAQTKARETAILQAVDHVALVSPAEVPHVKDIISLDKISVFPALYCSVVPDPPGYRPRRHLFFLGGFAHTPNIGAAIWFVENVWPAIHAALPDVEFHIIGAEAPEQIVELGHRPGVRFVGYVPDLDPVLASYRLSVAPLLFGAGIKGKLGTAMGAGVPSVVTTIAAEGMNIVDGYHALVRDDPALFAEAVVRLYQDENLWNRVAHGGRALVEGNFGAVANQASCLRLLDRAGALPVDLYVKYCRSISPSCFPDVAPEQPIDVSIIIPAHDKWDGTRACLNSVLYACRATGIPYEVILADDASTDDTRRAAEFFPGLKIVRQEKSLGFLRNCNAAVKIARGRRLLFLGSDTVVMPNWLTALMDAVGRYPDAAILGSKLLNPDSTIQSAGSALFADGTALNLGRSRLRHDPRFCFDREVDYASDASVLVTRAFWTDVGGFDERFSPAGCEDSDLAMAARARGSYVIYVAASEAVRAGHRKCDSDLAAVSQVRQSANIEKLSEKWRAELSEAYLSASIPEPILAANGERTPLPEARERRARGHLNILFFSPFPSHPDTHGNQASIQSTGRHFQQLGHKVHFVLLKSAMVDEAAIGLMRDTWDTFDLLYNTRPLWADGNPIPFDHWYQEGLGEEIAALCRKYDIDLLFCSYIFQSKLLEYVPGHILKVIDTHDKMGNRYEMLRSKGQPLEFFSCSPEEEGEYLRRADVVLARRDEEANYFDEVSGRKSSLVIPHVAKQRFVARDFTKVANVGVVASANQVNLAIVSELVKTLVAREQYSPIPFKLHIAGQIRAMVKSLPADEQRNFRRPWIRLHGFVPDIEAFYRMVDVVISPVTMGTGINIKTIEALAHGVPLLSTRWGAKGISTTEPMHLHEDLASLCDGLFDLYRDPSRLNDLAAVSRASFEKFRNDTVGSIDALMKKVKI